MSDTMKYCRNCGTRLNGQAYCPNCQKPTGESSPARAQKPIPSEKQALPKQRKRLIIALAWLPLLLLIGIPSIIGGVNCHRQRIRQERWDYLERIEQASDEYLQTHMHNPLCASEWGNRLWLRASKGLDETNPNYLSILQKRQDEAGHILLEALEKFKPDEKARESGDIDFASITVFQNLRMWQESVLDYPYCSRQYWEDADFRHRVETALGRPTSQLQFD